MATYTYPTLSRAPSDMVVQYRSNTDVHVSPITGAIQSVDRGGEHLVATLTYNNLKTADRALLIGFIAKLNGQQHRVTLPFLAVDNQGLFGGTPLVAGGSQTGKSLDIDGCSNSITGWMKAGDVFSVNGEIKIATDDASTDGSGTTTLNFSPRLRNSPADTTAIETTSPVGTFILESGQQGWNYKPGYFSDIVLQFMEDIAA